jgi:hypothetical protein
MAAVGKTPHPQAAELEQVGKLLPLKQVFQVLKQFKSSSPTSSRGVKNV